MDSRLSASDSAAVGPRMQDPPGGYDDSTQHAVDLPEQLTPLPKETSNQITANHAAVGLSNEDLDDIWSWNAIVPEASEAPVHELIAQTVAVRRESVAVSAWDGEWTYKDLDTLSTQLALYLLSLGNGQQIIPLCFEKSRWMPVAMLGVMKAGAASVALEPSQPTSRLRAAVDQISPSIILSGSSTFELASTLYTGARVVVVDWLDSNISHDNCAQSHLPLVVPSDPLYILFTSGTTGTPKGVIINHGNFSSAVRHQKHFMYGISSRVLDFASYAFDVAWSNLIFTLVAGGCLCIPSEDERKNDLAGSIARMQITHADLTPSVARLLPESAIRSLEALIVGGEQLRAEDAQKWSSMTTVHNMYGPSECTPTAAMTTICPDTGSGSIGEGAGVCTWIIDPRGELTPIGCVGELALEGPLVGPGYLDHERTATAFLKNPPWLLRGLPEGTGRSATLYKTGDLVRYSADGNLTFIGRMDMRAKIKGQLVELSEIENTARNSLPTIANVVVDFITPSQRSVPLLVAFLEPTNRQDAAFQEFKESTFGLDDRIAMTLPAYMVPSMYLPIQSFPETTSGKTDRQALRAMAERLTFEQLLATTYRKNNEKITGSGTLKQLQSLWSSVLSIDADTIGTSDSFLRMGGDSIGAMRLVAKAREHGLHITVADIMRRPRLGDLARLARPVDHFKHETIRPFCLLRFRTDIDEVCAKVASMCNITTEQVEDVFPCTPLQEGLLALTAKRPGDYVATHMMELRPNISSDRFRAAWAKVIAKVPTLRTRIIDLPGQGLVQVLLDEQAEWAPSTSKPTDARTCPETQDLSILGSRLVQFSIENMPGDCEHRVFTWTLHHSLYDGQSIAMILEALERAYFGEQWTPAPAFQEFVRHVLTIDRVQADRFWERQMQEMTAPAFPVLPSPSYVPEVRQSLTRHVPDPHFPQTDVTASTIIRAAWALVISQYTDSKDVVFGVTVTGRQAAVPGVDRMTGPTIATVPVRVLFDSSTTIENMLLGMQTQSIEMSNFEQVGLQQIRRINDDCELACEFQSLLIVQPKQDRAGTENSRLFSRFFHDSDEAGGTQKAFFTYALTVTCIMGTGGVEIRTDFDPNVLESSQVMRIASQMEHILRQLCRDENSKCILSTLQTISEDDLSDIWDWNDTVPKSVDVTVHDLITTVAQAQPHKVAICAWDGTWNYGELDSLSTRLAYYVKTLNILHGNQLVPLIFNKSKWTSIAMLAAMKVGAASVTLDPSQPEDRLRKILEQLQSPIILCSSGNRPLAAELAKCVVLEVDECLLDKLWQAPLCWIKDYLPIVCPLSILYCVFTSGTTGIPKGVLISHANFSTSIIHQQKLYGFDRHSRVYDFASYAFDAAWMNVLVTLSCGGCLCVPSDSERVDDLPGSIARLRATHIDLTPSVARLLPAETLRQLHTLIVAGEPLKSDEARHWAQVVNLKNVYGPAECTPTSTMADIRSIKSYPSSFIGRGRGVCTWVVDTTTGTSLVPIGGVGELYIEGPLVGSGYLNDHERTKAHFIQDPPWLLQGKSKLNSGRRGCVYKTGDLVRYSNNGNLCFVGRKDTRIKIHGQLVELEEIEHHVRRYKYVRQCACLMPLAGVYAKRLVCLFSLHGVSDEGSNSSMVKQQLFVVQGTPLSSHLSSLRELLDASLPVYMVPAVWICMDDIPLSTAGKLDRTTLYKWLVAMEVHSYDENKAMPEPVRSGQQVDVESILLDACSHVLGIPAGQLDCQRSFIGNGGDSISAMRLVPYCRAANIQVTVAALLQNKSIANLADSLATSEDVTLIVAEGSEKPFALSPIQRWFAKQITYDDARRPEFHYNQSFYLQLRRYISPEDMSQAVSTLVESHPMLRARFWQDQNEDWYQSTPAPGKHLHSFQYVPVIGLADIEFLSATRQQEIDIGNGPVFSVDLCEEADGRQYLILIAHHLTVDLVSWRILLNDLQTILNGEKLQFSFSFQVWNEMQTEKVNSSKSNTCDLLSTTGIFNDLDFWGMQATTPNTRSDQETMSVSIDIETTRLLLGDANRALQTGPLDLLLSAVWLAFFETFPERQGLTIWNEGHGRESWSPEIDLSSTVGWFTTISPIHTTRVREAKALVEYVAAARKNLALNGWAYFTSKYLAPVEILADHGPPVEVEFNYHGQFQELERDDSLFDPIALESVADEGPSVPAPHLFGIDAVIQDGKTLITISWNRHISHQHRLQSWFFGIQSSLETLCKDLVATTTTKAISNHPFLKPGYDKLTELQRYLIPHLESINHSTVVEVLPCSPTVTGILLSQLRQPELYKVCETYELTAVNQTLPSTASLAAAWQKVVAHQPNLRSVLTSSLDEISAFHQCVLGSYQGEVLQMTCKDRATALQELKSLPPLDCRQLKPPHRVACCLTNDCRIICQIEMSHAITDAASNEILIRNWIQALQGTLSTCNLLDTCREFARAFTTIGPDSQTYWKQKLEGVSACYLPRLVVTYMPEGDDHAYTVRLEVPKTVLRQLHELGRTVSVTLTSLFQAAWALTLASYCGSDSVCFGYLGHGRDLPITGLDKCIGAHTNLMVCRVDHIRQTQARDLVLSMHNQVLHDREFQHCYLAAIQHELKLAPGRSLFNSSLNCQMVDSNIEGVDEAPSVLFDSIDGQDPTEYDVSISVNLNSDHAELGLEAHPSFMSCKQAQRVLSLFLSSIHKLSRA